MIWPINMRMIRKNDSDVDYDDGTYGANDDDVNLVAIVLAG